MYRTSLLFFIVVFSCETFANQELLPNEQTLTKGVDVSKYIKVLQANEVVEESLIENRVEKERKNLINPFAITPHKPNYFLPFRYQSDIDAPDLLPNNEELDKVEFVFQLSVKVPVAHNILGEGTSLWGAYTQKAAWQAYNSDSSAPFRETNHEPELFVAVDLHPEIGSVKPKYVAFGFNHQSNGRNEGESRSWNRLFVELFYEIDNTVISIKPWYRLSENNENDDNPNIEKYYGYGELNAVHVINEYSIDLMLRNNLRSKNRGALQLGFAFPLWGKSQGYVQYFNGYGQSLIEYNKHTKSIGFGVILTNWL